MQETTITAIQSKCKKNKPHQPQKSHPSKVTARAQTQHQDKTPIKLETKPKKSPTKKKKNNTKASATMKLTHRKSKGKSTRNPKIRSTQRKQKNTSKEQGKQPQKVNAKAKTRPTKHEGHD